MKELTNLERIKEKFPEIAEQIERIAKNPDTISDINKFVIEETKDGLVISHKEWSKSKCIIKDGVITADAGSLLGKVGDQNEFLNDLLPNKTYIVDGYTKYITDSLSRVVLVISDRNKNIIINHGKPYDKTQERVRKEGVEEDEAGHLISRATGGANEKINLVPMNRDINRQGKWRKMEEMEEKALKEGKTVFSKREPLYKGDSKRPYAIKTTTIIDGKKYTQVIKNP
ncbi:DNA/RNA non-specific endonuclease [Prevotella sp. Rep29]|uniref:DNA/RNA non-specific endonuclease n=1 Tax=Prevotella sp. Rep29 TaxID=2691580 RepID=UPI001C6DE43C|nr:DNA/RNA non-specific endonuclease [Prevotella sp. Rep29]QYR11386.1 hypothetical protein GRF55_09990 [Prevotella sp. Rep29]